MGTQQEIMDNIGPASPLPENPLDHVGGLRYLRLSNDCPPKGLIMRFTDKPLVVVNKNFDTKGKYEYQWPVDVFTPPSTLSESMILVESGKNFCTALKRASEGKFIGESFHVIWSRQPISKGREIRAFIINKVDQDAIQRLFKSD